MKKFWTLVTLAVFVLVIAAFGKPSPDRLSILEEEVGRLRSQVQALKDKAGTEFGLGKDDAALHTTIVRIRKRLDFCCGPGEVK
jgi:hypothetical protein